MIDTAGISLAFVGIGGMAALLMMWLWGFPYDEERGRSTAPRWLAWLHRCLGYTYILILFYICTRMIPRLWLYHDEFSSLAAIHASLGFFIIALLFTKVSVVRFYPVFQQHLPLLGIPLMILTMVMVLLVLGPAFHEWQLSRKVGEVTDRVSEILDQVPAMKEKEIGVLTSEEGLNLGRQAFIRSCTQCHGLRRILSKVSTPADWWRTIKRMSEKTELSEYNRVSEQEQKQILAYLLTIRMKGKTVSTQQAEAVLPGDPPIANSQLDEMQRTTGSGEANYRITGAPAALEQKAMDIFESRCVTCHSGTGAAKGLRLESAKAVIGSTALVPGNAADSEIIRRVKGESNPRMPMDGPPYLTASEIKTLEQWISALNEQKIDTNMESPLTQYDTNEQFPKPGPGDSLLFSHVQPIFLRYCVKCHAQKGVMGAPPEGLILSRWEEIVLKPEKPVVVAGQPMASNLLRHIKGLEQPRMPFDGPPWLSKEQTDMVVRWIQEGAHNANGQAAPVPYGKRVKLRGQLQSRWQIDGAPFKVTSRTELRNIAIGSIAELRARIDSDGSLIAERLRGR